MASADSNVEVALARDLMAGKPGAFERFVDHFRSKIFKYASLICGQREDAEEVAQDTLMKVFENFDQLREPERVRAWVFRIARNGCLMKRRKSVFAPTQELSLEDFMPQAGQDGARRLEIADWSALPDEQALRGELRSVILKAIEELPEIYRGTILLRDIEELSTEEAAQVLDVGPEVIKTRLHRARLAVRQKIDEYLKSAQSAGTRER
ncbi:MAG TPA: sigma-70 family RNA polymerase sigma factor [Bryobacteraceae bacterium]|nr:sigma-70 family RNA polymerase sigma factor [Bryobacteraceae bacterium]